METAKTSEHLAQELEKVGLNELAAKARANHYHDYFSESATPISDLVNDLADAGHKAEAGHARRAILTLRTRAINGDFDASDEESNEWAASQDGRETFDSLIKKR